jgi:type II secretory pathway predicted ATPase ExeA/LysM repeat protein
MLDHFHFVEQPFGAVPDNRFWFFGHVHREALASLIYNSENERGISLVTGAPGTGKTSLLLRFAEAMQPHGRVLFPPIAARTPGALARWLLHSVEDSHQSQNSLPENAVSARLAEAINFGGRLILLIDEADSLNWRTLEWLRRISNPSGPSPARLQLVLAGRPGIVDRLKSPGLGPVAARISCVTNLEPLGAETVPSYIAHRLWIAGCQRSLFTAEALSLVAEISRGIPRRINHICFDALSIAYASGKHEVDGRSIRHAAENSWHVLAPEAAESECSVAATVHPIDIRQRIASRPLADRIRQSAAKCAAVCHALAGATWSKRPSALTAIIAFSLLSAMTALFAARKVHAKPPANERASISRVPRPMAATALPAVTPAPANGAADHATIAASSAKTQQTAADPQAESRASTVRVVVEKGTTLRQLSLAYSRQYNPRIIAEICALNGLADPNHIAVGQTLRVPIAPSHPTGYFTPLPKVTSVDKTGATE